MRSSATAGHFARPAAALWPTIALLAAAAALYVPIFVDFSKGPWREDENAHALIILAIAGGAAYARLASETLPAGRRRSEIIVGGCALAIGLALAVIGRASETVLFQSASLGPVAAGIIVSLFGWNGLRRLWFPVALTVYLIIWPGWAIDALTAPLKTFVSEVVSEGLYAAGYPVAHAGAVISAGPYQLLVADACSGLNSVIALTAVGAVYLYAVKHGDWRVNALVIAALVPIAIAANVLRVAALVLITHHFGYDAGQG
ncbi:MAG: exosortase, partial [Parvularculaceae bacterium]|nr:exosortase [Parvularculaceae bacterium]